MLSATRHKRKENDRRGINMPDPITPPVAAPVVPATPVASETSPATLPNPAEPLTPVAEAPLYTNKQLNDLLARDAGKEVKKLLAEAGFDPSGDIKADLAKLKTIRDGQLTEEQKRAEKEKAAKDEIDTAKREASEAKIEASALRAGLKAPEKDGDENDRRLKRFVRLANGYDGTEAEKVAAVLADFPEFVRKEAPGDVGRLTKGSQVNEEEALLAQMKKNAGIK